MTAKRFENIDFVGKHTVLAKYLTPSALSAKQDMNEEFLFFPFGCNNSQYNAVENAMKNQISVIEGPPGIGKTQTILNVIVTFQLMYYETRKAELDEEIKELENDLKNVDKDLLDDLCNQSMSVLKDKLGKKYRNKRKRGVFDEEDLWKKSGKFLEEYPVILSMTFSSGNSLNANVVYAYLIMDEAS